MQTRCDDCGRPYGDPGFPDLIVPNAVWRRITPRGDGSLRGLLCPSCICARCERAGLRNVPAGFASGPLEGVSREATQAWREIENRTEGWPKPEEDPTP